MTSKLEHVVGDLLESEEMALGHGCNTKGLMGAGIAGAIAVKWRRTVFVPYYEACLRGDFVPGTSQLCITNSGRTVFNLATQDEPGPHADQWWVLLALGNMFEQCIKHGIDRVAIPRLGCGIGGLQWLQVETAIHTAHRLRPAAPMVVVYTHPAQADKIW